MAQPLLIDRSRLDAFQRCPRFRFLKYHYAGRGLTPVVEAYELLFGRLYAEALDRLRRPQADDTAIIKEMADRLRSALPPRLPTPQYAEEQTHLIQALLWAWVQTRRPLMFDLYEIVGLEQELLWFIGPEIAMMVRMDGLVRDRATGDLYYWEDKTTAYGNEAWARQFDHNAQVMANTLACAEAFYEKPVGVLIEGHVKGTRRYDKALTSEVSGTVFQDSPLCYLWQNAQGDLSSEWKRGSVRTSAWTLNIAPQDWVRNVMNSEERQGCFRTLPPIMPDPVHLERWRRQTLHQERRLAKALDTLAEARQAGDSLGVREILDRHFPLHETSCWAWGRPCDFLSVCHDAAVAQDPMAGNAFVPRVPHHQPEVDRLVNPSALPEVKVLDSNPTQP